MRDQADHEVEPADASILANDLDLVTWRRISATQSLFATLLHELAMLRMHQVPKCDAAQLCLCVPGDVLCSFVEENKMIALVDEDRGLRRFGERAEFVLALEQRFMFPPPLAQVPRDALHPHGLAIFVNDSVIHF